MLDNNERMNTIICLIIVIIFLIFITLYLFTKKDIPKEKETFTTAPPAQDSTPSTPTAPTMLENILKLLQGNPSLWTKDYMYIEPLNDIPYYKNLVLYGTIFSDKTHYDKEVDVYIPTMSRWNNFIKDGQHFFMNATSLPPKIKSPEGLLLKDRSLSIHNDDNVFGKNFEITQFTVTMVLKFNTIDFGTSTEIELLSIALETPNVIRLTLEPDPDNDENVFLYSHIGDNETGSKSGISIVKTTFDDEITLSFVYLKDSAGNCRRYLFKNGTTNMHTSESYVLNYPLKLGITGAIINKGKNLDATLNMFMYHDMAFTDVTNHTKIHDYYTTQKSGLATITSFINNVTKEQLLSIKSIIDDSTITQAKMKEELDKCMANKTPQKEEFKYKISSIGNVQLSDEDIGSCPLLNIDKRISSSPSSSPLEKAKKTQDSKFPYYIKLPF